MICAGGHYPGGVVLHWAAGAGGKGALLSGDIVQVVQDNKSVSFMWSFPNFIPLSAPRVEGVMQIAQALQIRPRARRLHRPHHLVRRQGRGGALGRTLPEDHPRRRLLRIAVTTMRPPRRQFLRLAAAAAALPAMARIAGAQAYPNRPVRLILGFAAGGSADIVARLLAQFVSDRIGQPVIVENRTGASSNLAGEAAARSAPDGYTLLFVTTVNAINATFFDNLKFDLQRDFAPVSGVARVPNVLEINPSVPANTVAEFIAYAKANPGKLNMASTGNGTSIHLAGELFKAMTGTNLVHVPYRSPPQAMTDLLADFPYADVAPHKIRCAEQVAA